jgi:hypothetical protein
MAQAQGSLSSVSQAVEGVLPLSSSSPLCTTTGVSTDAPTPGNPATPYVGGIAQAGVSLRGNHRDAPAPQFPRLRKSYILRFRNGAFLHSYKDDGIYFTFDLQRARLFSIPPSFVSDCFSGEVLTVLTNPDGSGLRRTILEARRDAPGDLRDLPSHGVAQSASARGENDDGESEKRQEDDSEGEERIFKTPGRGEANGTGKRRGSTNASNGVENNSRRGRGATAGDGKTVAPFYFKGEKNS